ncbi:MAG: sigma-70 family RNA polymerase sigma factor [Acidimicrobiales bacterium]
MTDTQAQSGRAAVEALLTPRGRAELTGFCYRMLGSAFDADDAVQETLTRAWRSADRFEGRSQARTWLYRIASNVCLDALKGRQRRATPLDFEGPSRAADGLVGQPLAETTWIEPIPDGRLSPAADDPAEQVAQRESVKLAFVAALQHLPPQQRAVLILREVLRWQASEVAELLDTSVAGVNSALQRARATLAAASTSTVREPTDDETRAMLARYVEAFERYDMDALTALIKDDATQSMPPYAMWLRGRDEILAWWQGPGADCRGSRLVATQANGSPAFAQYRRNPDDGSFYPWALQTFELADGAIASFTIFLDTGRLFPLFGLPPTPPDRYR